MVQATNEHSGQEQPGTRVPGTLRILRSARLLAPLAVVACGLLAMFAAAWLHAPGQAGALPLQLLVAGGCAMLGGLVLTALRLERQLFGPLVKLENSVAKVCQGEPGARLSREDTGVLAGMVEDIDSLNEELTDLYEDMDSRVARHTSRLAQKTASLKILYDVAASINQAGDLDALLLRFLRVLKEMVNGMAATVRLVDRDGRMRLVGSIGLDDAVVAQPEGFPVDLCMCGAALSPGDILCERSGRFCSRELGRAMFDSDEVDVISVALDYQDEVLGMYNIFVRQPGISGREDIRELLETISHHLGMAVAKQRSDAEARKLSIMQERTALAHELHDSLAQTLVSLRFQVRLLQDVIGQGDNAAAAEDVLKIRNGIDEAHTELRQLLNSFRAPVEQRGLIKGLEDLLAQFGQETGIHTLFQQQCAIVPALSPSEDMQILRIAQECLANIRKHARAHTVRILLSSSKDGTYTMLVEDDGVGFESAAKSGRPGEHIGLSIMEERALRLGGNLRIESEPGDGTRVELEYRHKEKPVEDLKQNWIV